VQSCLGETPAANFLTLKLSIAPAVASQPVKPVAGQIQPAQPGAGIERGQKPTKSGRMPGVDPASIAAL